MDYITCLLPVYVNGSLVLYDCYIQPTLCIETIKCIIFARFISFCGLCFGAGGGMLPCIDASNAFFRCSSSKRFCHPKTFLLTSCPSLCTSNCPLLCMQVQCSPQYGEHASVWLRSFGCRCVRRDRALKQSGIGEERHCGGASYHLPLGFDAWPRCVHWYSEEHGHALACSP